MFFVAVHSSAIEDWETDGTSTYEGVKKLAQGTIRIYPTMILAKKSFAGSQDRGQRPYPFHRHHYELSGWLDKNRYSFEKFAKAVEVVCPKLFIRVPIGSECQCGERHFRE